MDTWKQSYSEHRIECDRMFGKNDDLSYTWVFQLDANLRLNLSFSNFFIKDIFTRCEFGKMLLYNAFPTGIADFTLCGRRPKFIHYSSSSSVFLEIRYKDTYPVEIHYSFSVFAKNIVSSVSTRSTLEAKYQINVQELHTHIIHLLNGTLSTFRIYAKKTLQICVKAKSGDRISNVFIDCPIITFSPYLHFKVNSSVICSSTFQLVFQIFTKTSDNYIGSNEHLNYKTQNADFKTIKINHMNEN